MSEKIVAEDETYIIKPKDPVAIVRLQDPTVIEQLLENPPAVLAEVLTGWFASGSGYWATAGCKIAQAAFKGRVFEQFAKEFNALRDKGRIPSDFCEKKYGYKSWVELLTVIDEDLPDEDRLEALKAMFFSVNKVNTTDGERIVAYQLFQVAKKLNSGELFLLRTIYNDYATGSLRTGVSTRIQEWAQGMAAKMGHQLSALVLRDEPALVDQGLISARLNDYPLQVINEDATGRLTDLGIRFCQNVETYRIELKPPQ